MKLSQAYLQNVIIFIPYLLNVHYESVIKYRKKHNFQSFIKYVLRHYEGARGIMANTS